MGPSTNDLITLIEAEIAAAEGPYLPTVASLARKFSVRIATLSSALSDLRSKGVVQYRRGTRVVISSRAHETATGVRKTAPGLASSPEKVAAILEDELAQGLIRAGQVLPKVNTISSKLHVSGHTVLDAFRLLAQRNLAHQVGRTWIAGSAPERRDVRRTSRSQIPFIAILQPRLKFWDGLHSERTRKFCGFFSYEAERNGIRLIPITAAEPVESSSAVFCNVSSVTSTIRNLKGYYLGTLVASGASDLEDFGSWCHELKRLGRPVVWFDRIDESILGQETGVRASASVIRCHFSESAVIRECVRFLTGYGHRVIGYPASGVYTWPWIRKREKLLRDICETYDPAARLIIAAPNDYIMRNDSPAGIAAKLERLAHEGHPVIRKTLFSMAARTGETDSRRSKSRSVYKALAQACLGEPRKPAWLEHGLQMIHMSRAVQKCIDEGATALIAANDWFSQRLVDWLKLAGVDVPGHVSVLSIDNYLLSQHLSISSVDYGFDTLAYQAFHAIRGEIPLRIGPHGSIACTPRVAIRDTVDQPRRSGVHRVAQGQFW